MRQREFAVVVGVERPDPRVEHLHGIDARVDLRLEVIGDHRRQPIGETMPRGRIAVHQALGQREVVRVAALDGVGRERERRAGKADERDPVAELAFDLPNGGEGERQRLARLDDAQRVDVGASIAAGCSIAGPSPLMKSKGMPIGSSGSSRSENRIAASTSMRAPAAA